MDLTHNIIEYVNCCVGAFANRFKLTLAQSYAYLRRFKGIDWLSGNLVGISINLCKSIQKELFINDTP